MKISTDPSFLNANLAFTAVAQLVPVLKLRPTHKKHKRRISLSENVSPELYNALLPQKLSVQASDNKREITLCKPQRRVETSSRSKETRVSADVRHGTTVSNFRRASGPPALLTQLRAAINADFIQPLESPPRIVLSRRATDKLLERLCSRTPHLAQTTLEKRPRSHNLKRLAANTRYVHNLAIPKKKLRPRELTPRHYGPKPDFETQQSQIARLSQHRCLDSTLTRISSSCTNQPDDTDRSFDSEISDRPLLDLQFPETPSPYVSDLSVMVPGRSRPSMDHLGDLRDRLSERKTRLLDIVMKCEELLPNEFDDWIAGIIEIEILPSLSRRPLVEAGRIRCPESRLKTEEALSLLDLFQPNELLIRRLDHLRVRIGERVESLVN